MGKYQVLFHVDEEDPEKVRFALNNIHNLLQAVGEEQIAIELVANGPAVKAFTHTSEFGARVQQLNQRGVTFAMCRNAMNLFDLKPEDMMASTIVVPAGVAELTYKQAEGWAYIKP